MNQLYQDEPIRKHPMLPLLVYLIQKGCSRETSNKAGQRTSDILLGKGFSKLLIDFLDQTAAKWKRWPTDPKGCMGRNGQCAAEATFRLTCPHKATFVSCSSCVTFIFKLKWGCADEDLLPILAAITASYSQLASGKGSVLIESRSDVLKWIIDGTTKQAEMRMCG